MILSATGTVTPGAAYVVSIANPAGEAAESLLSPIAAIVARSERSYVYVRDGATFREVEVQVVGSVGGVAAIEPVDAEAALEAGMEVRVG